MKKFLLPLAFVSSLSMLSGCGGSLANSGAPSFDGPGSSNGAGALDPERQMIGSFADILRSQGNNDYLNDPNLYKVTTEFGVSKIPMNALPIRSATAEASVKPWTSWWYPKMEDNLFRDKNGQYSAPLTKYDLYNQKKNGRNSSAAAFEARTYNPNSFRWEGLCDAWAIASIVTAEPKRAITQRVSGMFSSATINFSVSDLKGLLLKTYDGVDDSGLGYYGQKFVGNEKGWIHPDLFPDQVHRFIEVMLFDQKRAFIMDHDPGVEVWNVPVYKANYLIEAVPGNPNAVSVRMWLVTVEAATTNEREFVGTKEIFREYDYTLYGTRDAAGNLVVESGVWTKGATGVDSRHDHPDYFISIQNPQAIRRASRNPEIDPRVVDEIVAPAL